MKKDIIYGDYVWFIFCSVLTKTVRDRLDGIPVTGIYSGLCWISVMSAILLLTVGLWNANLMPSEKGFYAMSFLLSLFGAVSVQKNIRDLAQLGNAGKHNDENPPTERF